MITAKLKGSDELRFHRALKNLSILSKKPIEEVLKSQGRLFAVNAAKFTNRVGSSPATGRKHKGDVKSTINSIYINPATVAKIIEARFGEGAAKRFRGYIRRRNDGKALDMITRLNVISSRHTVNVGMFDGGNRHTRWLSGNRKSVLVVMDYRSTVPKYRKEKMKNVGALKAGWAKAAEDLGGSRGIPSYAKKGHKGRGSGSVKNRLSTTVLKVSNRSNYILRNTTAEKLWLLQTRNMESVITRILMRGTRRITKKV